MKKYLYLHNPLSMFVSEHGNACYLFYIFRNSFEFIVCRFRPIDLKQFFYGLMGLYSGTSAFMIIHPMRYATEQMQKMMKYPAGFPVKPIKASWVLAA